MAITAAELQGYLAVNMPEDDGPSDSGGARDDSSKLTDLVLASASALEAVSSDAGDTTQAITVEGRDATGAAITDTKTLTGTTLVALTGTFERVNKVTLDATTTGTVTLRVPGPGATVCTLEPGKDKVQRNFINAQSESTTTTRYEKVFLRNTNSTLTLTSAQVQFTTDSSGNLTIGLDTTKDDTQNMADRLTAPTVVGGAFSGINTLINVPTNQLAAGEAIGVWLKYDLGIDEAAVKGNFTLQLLGNTIA